MFLTLLASQVISAVGYGEWFPWAVPALLAGGGGPAHPAPGTRAVALVLVVAGISAWATARWRGVLTSSSGLAPGVDPEVEVEVPR